MLTKRNGDAAARKSPPNGSRPRIFAGWRRLSITRVQPTALTRRPNTRDGQFLFAQDLPPTGELLYTYNNWGIGVMSARDHGIATDRRALRHHAGRHEQGSVLPRRRSAASRLMDGVAYVPREPA